MPAATVLLCGCGKQIDPRAMEIVQARRDAAEQAKPKTSPAPEFKTSSDLPERVPTLSLVGDKWDWDNDSSFYYITGRVTNNTARQLGLAMVSFNIYDDSGAQIGTTRDLVNNLDGHGVWRFKALVAQKNFRSAKLVELKGR